MKNILFILFSLSIFLENGYSQVTFSDKSVVTISGNDTIQHKIIVDSMKFPEGPAFDGKNTLYVSSCYGGWITRIENDSPYVFLRAGIDSIRQTNGLTIYKDGSIFACDFGKGEILRIYPNKKIEIYASGYEGKRFNRPNDLAFDPKGNLYFTDPKSSNKDIPDGIVYRIDAKTKIVTIASKDLAYPNGLAFSIDGKKMYLCESAKNRVLVFNIQKNGSLYNPVEFVVIQGGAPDGIALDSQENIYIAHFGGGNIYIFSKDRTLLRIIPTPGKKPSNIEFAGEDMRDLYFTEDETNSVYKIRNNIPGFRLYMSPPKK